jgi:large subunit ribosomal protein L29
MRIKELREKSKQELEDALKEFGRKLHDLRFQLKSGKVKNPHTYESTRRDIARVKTLLNEKR